MNGLIMDYPLTTLAVMNRAESLFGPKEIVSRRADRSIHRTTYAEVMPCARRLGVALERLGVAPGDRVATLCWNHYRHLEAYFGIPACGGVLHTLNFRLHAQDLAYIVNHAQDKVLIVDESVLPIWESFRDRVQIEHVIVVPTEDRPPQGMLGYEELLANVDVADYREPVLDERAAAAMCYTSGTTGQPKGVVYSHRAIVLHSLMAATVDGMGIGESDVVLPIVPMFHANAWGLPFVSALVGATQVFPGPHLDPASVAELLQNERATVTCGVPTIWLGMLQLLDRDPKAYDLSHLRRLLVGGSAIPRSIIEAFQERHGLQMLHLWGMTEMTPIGTLGHLPSNLRQEPADTQYSYRAKQGTPVPFVEIRARGADGLVPWDGRTVGELEVRGVWVASAYHNHPTRESFTADGWFRTGDIVAIEANGCVVIQDRAKDLIKSGGEWISSVALENALMGHPAVAEAAVIALPHPRWAERPLAVVVIKPGQTATAEELVRYLAPNFARWWLPEAVEFIDAIPRTAAGKFRKTALREQFRDYRFSDRGANQTSR